LFSLLNFPCDCFRFHRSFTSRGDADILESRGIFSVTVQNNVGQIGPCYLVHAKKERFGQSHLVLRLLRAVCPTLLVGYPSGTHSLVSEPAPYRCCSQWDQAGVWRRIPTLTPDHSHHQRQTQQTFHVQLLRLAYPDATNIEAGAHRVWPGEGAFSPDLTGTRA